MRGETRQNTNEGRAAHMKTNGRRRRRRRSIKRRRKVEKEGKVWRRGKSKGFNTGFGQHDG